MPGKTRSRIGLIAAVLLVTASWAGTAISQSPNIVQQQCTGCHLPEADGKLSRISYQRKTPEGWEMTINRMQLIHKLRISNQDNIPSSETKRQLVKYLADHQGLAPSEAKPYRYLIEQDLSVIEDFKPELWQMCGRCHSSARFALQRRSEDEWTKLVHYHMGQYPSVEYSLYGRDRDWYRIAIEETVPLLAELYPLETAAWTEWSASPKADYSGRWRLVGVMPGKGRLAGYMDVSSQQKDSYQLELTATFENGDLLEGNGEAIIFTGYEWRANLKLNGEPYRQVLAASENGNQMKGRIFEKQHPETGIRMTMVREDGISHLLSVVPSNIRPGEVRSVTLSGTGLQGKVDLGVGLQVVDIQSRDKNSITLMVEANKDAAPGLQTVKVGSATLKNALSIYKQVNSLRIVPAYAIARLGDNGGSTVKSLAPFTAYGIDHGPDGKIGTEHDVEVGPVQASCTVEPFDESAKKDRDVNFAGKMSAASGIFTPAGAGPNPERNMSTNNAGNLKVVAVLEQDGHKATGEAQLIVTVQRWNNPPLK